MNKRKGIIPAGSDGTALCSITLTFFQARSSAGD